jgi:hypothetical protein
MGRADEQAWIDGLLAAAGTTARSSIISTVESLDVDDHLLAGGLTSDRLQAVRRRLVDASATGRADRPTAR